MPEVFAHRGLHHTEIENSVASFAAAKAIGVDGVELDVRRTSDGALVVFHDGAIDGVGFIHEVTLAQLPSHVATLAEAMEACALMTVNVEIKNHVSDPGHDPSGSLTSQTMELLREGGWLDGILISSFDLATCEQAKALAPNVPVGWLLDWREPLAPNLTVARDAGLDAVHPYFLTVNEADVAAAHAVGLAVNVWTVNTAHDLQAMYDLGVDDVITDDPELALSLLR